MGCRRTAERRPEKRPAVKWKTGEASALRRAYGQFRHGGSEDEGTYRTSPDPWERQTL
jgi:hypothetical protein